MEMLKGISLDLKEENLNRLKEIFPEVFEEGKIDFEKLRLLLGDNVEEKEERYEFNWNGKRDAIRIAQTPSTGTLRPDKESSKNWDDTENLYIEGDNLEVLKLLQKSYFGKVKMIYIDPPYNTGKDFVYKDNFSDSIANYKEITSQTTKANSETNGRYHTDWLNMMYPRLKLARNLLKEDGIIFISINDKEYDNIKKICDEIFSEDNNIANLIWDRNNSAQAGIFKVYHEYILVYCKNKSLISTPRVLETDIFEARAIKKESNRHSPQVFKFPKGTKFIAPENTILEGRIGSLEYIEICKGDRLICKNQKLDEDARVIAPYTQINQMKEFFYGDKNKLVDSRGQKIVEFYLSANGKVQVVKERGVITPSTILKLGPQGPVSKKLADLFELKDSPLDSPKPVKMVETFLEWFIDENDIIVDFFSGSSTTAESVIKFNSNYNKHIKYIMVQIPEQIDSEREVYKAGYKNICEIGKERIRRAGYKIVSENKDKEGIENLDIGFKVFKLDSSNLKSWDSNKYDLENNLLSMDTNIKNDRSNEDLLYEILLKSGIELTTKIEEIKVGYNTLYNIGCGALLVCLDDKITQDVIDEIPKHKSPYMETKVIFKEAGFMSDAAKINAIQNLKQFQIEDVRSV